MDEAELKLWIKSNVDDRLIRLEEKYEASIKALELQANEYSRRLDVLNHAHQKHESFVATFTSMEKFGAYVDKNSEWKELVNERLSELKGAASQKSISRFMAFNTVTIIVSLIAVVLAWAGIFYADG